MQYYKRIPKRLSVVHFIKLGLGSGHFEDMFNSKLNGFHITVMLPTGKLLENFLSNSANEKTN